MTRSHVLKKKRNRRRAHRAQKPRPPRPQTIYLGGFGKLYRFKICGDDIDAWECDSTGAVAGQVISPSPRVLWQELRGPAFLARLSP